MTRRAVALIGREVRIDGPEETQYRAELAELRKRNREHDDATR